FRARHLDPRRSPGAAHRAGPPIRRAIADRRSRAFVETPAGGKPGHPATQWTGGELCDIAVGVRDAPEPHLTHASDERPNAWPLNADSQRQPGRAHTEARRVRDDRAAGLDAVDV